MDVACSKEFDRMEALRRMEISRGLGLAARDRMRAVRREKMRWAVSVNFFQAERLRLPYRSSDRVVAVCCRLCSKNNIPTSNSCVTFLLRDDKPRLVHQTACTERYLFTGSRERWDENRRTHAHTHDFDTLHYMIAFQSKTMR